jgi:hypothetical protein
VGSGMPQNGKELMQTQKQCSSCCNILLKHKITGGIHDSKEKKMNRYNRHGERERDSEFPIF